MSATSTDNQPVPDHADLVIYGGTSSGLAAALQARRMGKKVVVIEPSSRCGGLTTNGLGHTDIGAKAAVGGIAREFYRAIRSRYSQDGAWKWQERKNYRSSGQSVTGDNEDTMWTFEPSVALEIFMQWIQANDIVLLTEMRLQRGNGVIFTGPDRKRISRIVMESGQTFSGDVFIDATYEGDLMADAGVSYFVGRESNTQYGETLNGVQVERAVAHQLVKGVDPYRQPGVPASGLLPFIESSPPGPDGTGDRRIQAYCYRMCLTDHASNRLLFEKPEGYDELTYELLFRNLEAGEGALPWINAPMPNCKTDTNNARGVSSDLIGQNYDFPEASYAQRKEIAHRHLTYQQGLMWALSNHPRVPESIRSVVSQFGLCRDEFSENGGWPVQLYVREARRMQGEYVVTQADCLGERRVEDGVALAAYTIDSHNTHRYVGSDGYVHNEGDVQVRGFPPYPISYRAIIPKTGECENLLVPVCLSASHVAYGSIRMEPVFMALGQAAATAAVQSMDERKPVQAVDCKKLRQRLCDDHQVI
jgi:hypothetical protein